MAGREPAVQAAAAARGSVKYDGQFDDIFKGILAAAETGRQEPHCILDPAIGSRCPMILAEKPREIPHRKGVFEFLLGLVSPRHGQGFRKAQEKPARANWWPTSPGYL